MGGKTITTPRDEPMSSEPERSEVHATGEDDLLTAKGRVLVIEPHELLATGVQLALASRGWVAHKTFGPSACDILAEAQRFDPDCVLMETRLGDTIGDSTKLIEPLAANGVHVVMLTAERRRPILAECLEAGAAGWIKKSADLDEVDATLRRLLAGGTVVGRTVHAEVLAALQQERERTKRVQATFDELTEREALVLAALSDGLSADRIATEHFVALTTVRSQIRGVLQKLGVRSQLEAVAIASAHRELLPDRGQLTRDRRRQTRPEGEDLVTTKVG